LQDEIGRSQFELISNTGSVQLIALSSPGRLGWFWDSRQLNNMFGDPPKFYYYTDAQLTDISVPHWFLILILSALAAVPWTPPRFNLRLMLITMSLIAVVLGLIVYVARK
jgi:hypothetical protein